VRQRQIAFGAGEVRPANGVSIRLGTGKIPLREKGSQVKADNQDKNEGGRFAAQVPSFMLTSITVESFQFQHISKTLLPATHSSSL
jgi:hypothetical protein